MVRSRNSTGPEFAVIFDLDGTLVDTEPIAAEQEKIFLESLGVEPRDLEMDLQGLNANAYFTQIKKAYGLDLEVDELINMWRPRFVAYLESLDQIPVIPGAAELVQHFASENEIALASSANPKRIDMILRKTGFDQNFRVIVHGDEVARNKPAPDAFLLAAQKLEVDPSDCVVVEDAANGVRAAKAAGMLCIAYAGLEHNHDDLTEADLIVTDYNWLISVVQNQGWQAVFQKSRR